MFGTQRGTVQCAAANLHGATVLTGGPGGWSHREHEHPEAQVTIHIPSHSAAPLGRGWIVPANCPHAGGWPDGTVSIVFHLTAGLLAVTADELMCRGRCDLAGGEIADPLILQLGSAVAEEMASGHDDRLFLDSVKHVLAARLIRRHSRTAVQHLPPKEQLMRGQMLALREFIESRFDQKIAVAELAAAVRMTPQRLGRALSASTGFSPHAFVNHVRIERAKQLLTCSHLTLAQIAFTLGFASQSHFTAVFRRFQSVTLGEYRNPAGGRGGCGSVAPAMRTVPGYKLGKYTRL